MTARESAFLSLQKYERILKERNSLLKNALDDRATYDNTIEFWNEQLCHEAAIISRIVYTLVALAGIWCISLFFRERNDVLESTSVE